jgi:hypothetical protein
VLEVCDFVPKVVLADAANGIHLVQLGADTLDAQSHLRPGLDDLTVVIGERRRGALHRELQLAGNHLRQVDQLLCLPESLPLT